jgi:predicted nucleic acid-binding protein
VSAIVRKARSGGLAAADLANALADFRADFAGALSVVAVDAPVIDEAMRLAQQHGLRAYDAVQLAAVLKVKAVPSGSGDVPVTLVSADTDLSTAAKAEGLAVDDPNAHP